MQIKYNQRLAWCLLYLRGDAFAGEVSTLNTHSLTNMKRTKPKENDRGLGGVITKGCWSLYQTRVLNIEALIAFL